MTCTLCGASRGHSQTWARRSSNRCRICGVFLIISDRLYALHSSFLSHLQLECWTRRNYCRFFQSKYSTALLEKIGKNYREKVKSLRYKSHVLESDYYLKFSFSSDTQIYQTIPIAWILTKTADMTPPLLPERHGLVGFFVLRESAFQSLLTIRGRNHCSWADRHHWASLSLSAKSYHFPLACYVYFPAKATCICGSVPVRVLGNCATFQNLFLTVRRLLHLNSKRHRSNWNGKPERQGPADTFGRANQNCQAFWGWWHTP